MREDIANGGTSNIYNHVEEVITTDDWGDEETYVKGVMEEIQVSVQKLVRPARASTGKVTADAQTENVISDTEVLKATYDTRIANLIETHANEKKTLEQSITDCEQKIAQLTQKLDVNKRFVEEISAEREAESREMLKLTEYYEGSCREVEKLQEKLQRTEQIRDDLESHAKQLLDRNEQLEVSNQQCKLDLQVCCDINQETKTVKLNTAYPLPHLKFTGENLLHQ